MVYGETRFVPVKSSDSRPDEGSLRLEFGAEVCQDLERASHLEWLETNGLGGWSFGTIAGLGTRRYHGMLAVASSPSDRRLLLSRLDETLLIGNERFDLGCRSFPGAIDPHGYRFLSEYRHELFPTFVFACGGVRIEKRVVALHGRNEMILQYKILDPLPAGTGLELRPLIAGRDVHALQRAADGTRYFAEYEAGVLRTEIAASDMQSWDLSVAATCPSRFRADPAWWYRFRYREEQRRGYDFEEDLWTPGILDLDIDEVNSFSIWVSAWPASRGPVPAQPGSVATSTKPVAHRYGLPSHANGRWTKRSEERDVPPSGPRDPVESTSFEILWEAVDANSRHASATPTSEDAQRVSPRSDEPNRCDETTALAAVERERRRRLDLTPAGQDPQQPMSILVRAADQFLVKRPPDGSTVIAGYPWFTDWGRDSLIALPGLCLVTGRHEEARQILETFAEHRQRGLVPNRFPDGGGPPEYNTADASLWFFIAVYKYLQYTGDSVFVQERMLPVLRDIVEWHERGTSFGIRKDADGLLSIGAAGQALTWMDARIDGRPVTAREGKPVDINALWIEALLLLGELEHLAGNEAFGDSLLERARGAKREFIRRFWNESRGCLFDVVDGPRGSDASIRPNQIFALSLPLPVVNKERARSILEVLDRELVTRCGLRSLSPHDTGYLARYEGSVSERDGAYHQGTVWSWLAGPYATALTRFGGRAGHRRARAFLEGMLPQLSTLCLGTFAEIFDGEAPHRPRGAVAQAWSVGEWLRAWYEDVLGE